MAFGDLPAIHKEQHVPLKMSFLFLPLCHITNYEESLMEVEMRCCLLDFFESSVEITSRATSINLKNKALIYFPQIYLKSLINSNVLKYNLRHNLPLHSPVHNNQNCFGYVRDLQR